MQTPDFLKEKNDIGIEKLDMNTLQGMIAMYDEYADKVEKATQALKVITSQFNNMALEQIPEFMLSHGMSELKLTDGRKVKIKEDISATITDEFAFRQWLKNRNEDAIIKVKYNMDKMSSNASTALADFLATNDYEYEIDESIHAQTKKKYFKELIKELGQEELPEWVKIYNIRKAAIK